MGVCDFLFTSYKAPHAGFYKKCFPREYLAPQDSIRYPCLTGKEAELWTTRSGVLHYLKIRDIIFFMTSEMAETFLGKQQ